MIRSSLPHNTPLARIWLLIPLLAVALAATPAPAQEVRWRHDYNAARRESSEKGRPLLIDFGTENCYWCKRLDITTFRDPAIVSLLNDRFVPLKVDARRDAPLADALHIESYPTLVLASQDGKILGSVEGYVEAPRLLEHLQRTLEKAGTPDGMQREFQEAVKLAAAGEEERASALLKNVTRDGQNRPVQLQARQLLRELESRQAAKTAPTARVAETVAVPHAPSPAVIEPKLTSLVKAAEEKGDLRERRARELLARTHDDFRAGQLLGCLERCEVLAQEYADLPESQEAMQLALSIKNNPDWMRLVCDQLSDRLGQLYLALAETWLKKGQPQQAILYLERVLQAFPNTRQAEAAQLRLAQIQGQPTPEMKK